ncbi:MAG: ABC transporter ATP-binding protein [Propionibacterium sp.]|nr:ABC transporter ATP-binding protein [Propionibacterium sp.]
MSDTKVVANERPEHAPQRGGGGGPHGGGGTGEKAANFWTSGKRLVRELRPERIAITVSIVLAALAVGLSVAGPKILGHATDLLLEGVIGRQFPAGASKEELVEATQQSNPELADLLENLNFVPGQGIDFRAIGLVLIGVLGLYLVSFLFSLIQGWVLNGAIQRTVYRMRAAVSTKIERLPLSYFDKQPRGELLSRVTNDIDNVSQTLQQTLMQLVTSLLTLIGVLFMMFFISPTLALVAILSIPVGMLVVSVIGKRSQRLFRENWAATGELNAHIEEAYTGQSLVKVFGRKREVIGEFGERNERLYKAGFGAQFVSGLIMPIMFFVGSLNYVVVAVIGGLRVASGTMNIGDVQAFIQYSRQFTQPLTQVSSMANLLQSGVASAERVFELMDADEMSEEPELKLQDKARGRIEFEHVDFSYSPETELIRDLNIVAEPGQTVAIVGPTGAGKTTLVNLIMRFYDLDGGRITLDGVDIATVARGEVRRNIAMVLQDTWLFGGTIWDNIAYGRPEATDDEIIEAAKATFVDRFVHSLPDGYETVIDEEGSNISAGEKQLITIARAFLADPALLILDEATSSVDTRTELLLQQAMTSLRTGRTSFVIAHRLSTIRDADVILVMRDGSIVEQGDHDQLLESKGAYYELYQSQFAAAITA